MALFRDFCLQLPFKSISMHRSSLLPRVSISETLIVHRNFDSNAFTNSSISVNHHSRKLPVLRCCTSSVSSVEEDTFPSTGIFIRGLPKSTSERSLAKTFSRFGEVDRVEIITYNKLKEPLGIAYVWFTSEEAARLAKKEMDGKFFNGRFIVVEIAMPRPSTGRVSATPYKF